MKRGKNKLVFYFVLIGMFNFLGLKPAIMQALIHSCFPFSDFLGHVIYFLQKNLGIFNGNIFQTLGDSLFNSYILASLREGMSKTSPLKILHRTQNFTMYYWLFLVFTFTPSFLTQRRIFLGKPYRCSKRSCKPFTNVCPHVVNVLN